MHENISFVLKDGINDFFLCADFWNFMENPSTVTASTVVWLLDHRGANMSRYDKPLQKYYDMTENSANSTWKCSLDIAPC